MEMEFKDNSRRRTLVLVIGVLLALGAGAAAFMLASQGTKETETGLPTQEVVVAADTINARDTIQLNQLDTRTVPLDTSLERVFTDRAEVAGKVAAVPIYAGQQISENMLAQAGGAGTVPILEPDATVGPDSPFLRAVSIVVPSDRAVGGRVLPGQHVDIISTMNFAVPEAATTTTTGQTGQTGQAGTGGTATAQFQSGSSTKLMWTDVPVIAHSPDAPEMYLLRMDLQQAEEVALAQSVGAQFTIVLRPDIDTRDIDRSSYGQTQDRVMVHYNFPIPEAVDAATYPQPSPYASPYPNTPYLERNPEPAPTPESLLPEVPLDTESPAPGESPAPEASPAP
jgi:Flp pilus assembly protein CpaB